MNQKTGTTRFEADEVDPTVFFQLEKMEIGEISTPIQSLVCRRKYCFPYFVTQNQVDNHIRRTYQPIINEFSKLHLPKKKTKSCSTGLKRKKEPPLFRYQMILKPVKVLSIGMLTIDLFI